MQYIINEKDEFIPYLSNECFEFPRLRGETSIIIDFFRHVIFVNLLTKIRVRSGFQLDDRFENDLKTFNEESVRTILSSTNRIRSLDDMDLKTTRRRHPSFPLFDSLFKDRDDLLPYWDVALSYAFMRSFYDVQWNVGGYSWNVFRGIDRYSLLEKYNEIQYQYVKELLEEGMNPNEIVREHVEENIFNSKFDCVTSIGYKTMTVFARSFATIMMGEKSREIVALMIEHGANPNAVTFDNKNNVYRPLLFRAITMFDTTCVAELVKGGAHVSLRTEDSNNVVEYMRKNELGTDSTSNYLIRVVQVRTLGLGLLKRSVSPFRRLNSDLLRVIGKFL